MNTPRNTRWLLLSALVVCLDQLSKLLILTHLTYEQTKPLLPVLNLTLRFNDGAAFSLFSQQSGWQIYFLGAVSLVVVIVLLSWLMTRSFPNRWMPLAISLIMGGAMGNLIDRLHLQLVVDFIDFHIKGWHFATFNLADAAVSVGACILMWRVLVYRDA